MTRHAFVDGRNAGEVYRRNGRWRWMRRSGVEPYRRGTTLSTVRAHIAQVHNVTPDRVEIRRTADEPNAQD